MQRPKIQPAMHRKVEIWNGENERKRKRCRFLTRPSDSVPGERWRRKNRPATSRIDSARNTTGRVPDRGRERPDGTPRPQRRRVAFRPGAPRILYCQMISSMTRIYLTKTDVILCTSQRTLIGHQYITLILLIVT